MAQRGGRQPTSRKHAAHGGLIEVNQVCNAGTLPV